MIDFLKRLFSSSKQTRVLNLKFNYCNMHDANYAFNVLNAFFIVKKDNYEVLASNVENDVFQDDTVRVKFKIKEIIPEPELNELVKKLVDTRDMASIASCVPSLSSFSRTTKSFSKFKQ